MTRAASSVGDGQISGQTATVDAGSSINVSGDFSIASILACRFIDCVNATNVERTANFKFRQIGSHSERAQ